jgi:hypothetical protein
MGHHAVSWFATELIQKRCALDTTVARNVRVRSSILIVACVGHIGAGALLLSLDSRHRRTADAEPPPLVVTVLDEPRFATERQAAQPIVLAQLPPLQSVVAPDSLASLTTSTVPASPRVDWMEEAARSACNVIARQESDQIPLMCKRRR